jgi:hypothetical protein
MVSDEEEGAETIAAAQDMVNYREKLPEIISRVGFDADAKVTKVQVKPGRKKHVEIVLVIAHETENTANLNDFIGEYWKVSLQHDVYRKPLTATEIDAMNQLWLEFENKVGA